MYFGKIDFLAIGDIMVDAFIKLRDAHINCKVNSEACELCVPFGDKIPYDSVEEVNAVGNAGNAAVCAARLGLKTAFVTNLGKDQNGKNCLNSLKKDGVDTKYISIQKNKATNYHYVLWYDIDRTILIKHTEFDYSFPKINKKIGWVYLTSLAESSLPYHQEIIKFLDEHPETKLAFQPGTFQIRFGSEKMKEIYKRTEVVFCNLEEAQKILNIQNEDPLILARGLQTLGPKMVMISDGPKGAYLYFNDELWHNPVYPDTAPPIDRTGAGDACSATMAAALALGKTPLEAFSWGPINSMSVVQYVGAQKGLLTREKLEEYLKVAPSNYKVSKIN